MNFISWLEHYRMIFVILHAFSFEIGAGAATLSYIFFMKAMKNFRISPNDEVILKTLANVIWAALAVIVLSGILLYLPAMDRLDASTKFLAKLIIVGVVIANGLFIHLKVQPRLSEVAFSRNGKDPASRIRFRQVAFACGGISLVSWYSATTLGLFRSLPYSTAMILAAYAAILAVVVSCAFLSEAWLRHRARKSA